MCSSSSQTEKEQCNIRIVKEYMEISYDPKRATAKNVEHLLAKQNRFIAPTTFPDVNDCETYAEEHGKLMKSINNLHIINFDYMVAKDNQVALRYSAEGSHDGEAYKSIKASGRHAKWTAAGLFKLDDNNKIVEFIKEWDKLAMWKQLGFPIEEGTKVPEK
ncbi:unnamed protein product [Didymodactylos carnosus]|uniref:Uncharacterized protein n=1 Tax=Didymodactylos carnosus TaxID=1234261 RepID=A0A814V319_9BILA|nr:unnamed protein product [Didymodactylos carnosus]CAF1381617.1 unnamed protein product [Didymodactylos carnosus]CAF3949901.1 unnamed protein product [Didymodactylos carnosus]CAF4190085.1 unnamed protein product [Didymodactylos carnosus]